MTLREFLVKNAPRQELERRRCREEWVAAVDRLVTQLWRWLDEANTDNLLELELLDLERREQGLGTYHVKGLAISFGERAVKIIPVGRSVLAHLGPYAEPGHENAEGRVDITNGINKYHLYRKLPGERWLVQDESAGIRPLDKAQFEVILQALLS